MAGKIQESIDFLRSAPNIEILVQYKVRRCHELRGDRKGQYAMDLVHPYRLIFISENEIVVSVLIEEITDYHQEDRDEMLSRTIAATPPGILIKE